jgi:hypothetical protein
MNLCNGLKEICYSLSGTFSLITLVVLAVVSWHTNSPIALAAFASIIPAVLTLAENREQLQQVAQQSAKPPFPNQS